MTKDATDAQNAAADPRFSTWLSANAGSGKTRVLTDRVARLLLQGTEPQNILCLTYTKAAASEMQNRLFRRLGEWAMMGDDVLRDALRALGEVSSADLGRARTLFARAIDAPGGLKIQTIHSFCSSILRQFPLEAGVSPQFRELDDTAQRKLIEDVIDTLAIQKDPSLGPITRITASDSLAETAHSIARHRSEFSRAMDHDAIFAMFGVPGDLTEERLVNEAVDREELSFLKGLAPTLLSSDKSRDRSLGESLAALPDAPDLSALLTLEDRFIFKSGSRAGQARIGDAPPSKDLVTGPLQPHMDRLYAIMERVSDIRLRRLALNAATKTAALHGFAQAFLSHYHDRKSDLGVLDFDDLIDRAGQLLTTRSLEWVLYRLDSGIEHILVDEAQDTSPDQWNVIDALAREITSGKGAGENRTIFVVGDKKQSIYSFQGADADEFDRMQGVFADRLSNGPTLHSRELHYSFRSSSAILSTVDAVFVDQQGRGLGGDVSHRAFHQDRPGRVDIWPLVPSVGTDRPPEWYDPVDRLAADDPKIILADAIAEKIDSLIGKETIQGENGVTRLVTAGDFLILVQGRGALFDQIIRACKARELPIAGADRLKIRSELAVRDLLALLSFLALQEDDLSLATVLRSPLFGWSEADLHDLAQGRKQPVLWAELRDRREHWADTVATLDDMLRQVDFLRPYELLEFILTRHQGRKKLLRRLGPEAEDGIDELLNQALRFESDEVPSLTTFVSRAQSEDIEIKRQFDATGDLIRVMTVHGAKGLESPIVILPDTTRQERPQSDPVLVMDNGVPVWRLQRQERPDIMADAVAEDAEDARRERQRLLYVAMTRAESWLMVCGTEARNTKENWYSSIAATAEALPHESTDTPIGAGIRVSHGNWPGKAEAVSTDSVTKSGIIDDFLLTPAAVRPPLPATLAPSDLGGAKTVSGGAKDEEAALRYGRQVHRLLEFLPRTDRTLAAAARILAVGPDRSDDAEINRAYNEARSALDAFPEYFQTDVLAEVDIAAQLPDLDRRMSGTIDRLLSQPGKVTAIDFKTNEVVPATPQATPEGVLRQMGAYLVALEQVFPDHEINLGVLWTAAPEITWLPHGIVREALARTTTS